jgi:hypothetical protein
VRSRVKYSLPDRSMRSRGGSCKNPNVAGHAVWVDARHWGRLAPDALSGGQFPSISRANSTNDPGPLTNFRPPRVAPSIIFIGELDEDSGSEVQCRIRVRRGTNAGPVPWRTTLIDVQRRGKLRLTCDVEIVPPAGIEPATRGLGNRCSIH